MRRPRAAAPPWRSLAELRYSIRRFLHFSERAARREGLLPQQHQALLVVRGAEEPGETTVGYLADRMFLRHNSAVELVDRLGRRGFLARTPHARDHRKVVVRLTPRGEEALGRLTETLLQEYRTEGPNLARSLSRVVRAAGGRGRS